MRIAIWKATSMSGRSWSRLALSIIDEQGTKAYRAVENADYQTQANAFRSLFNEKMKQ
jgi:hypothetical protein